MSEFVWTFPILFIFHDMEEIIGFGLWLTKNREFLDNKYPKISNTYKPYSTEGMAAAFMAYTVHLVIHIGQSIVIRKYIPALITSLICLPISIWVIASSITLLSYSVSNVIVYSLIGIVAIAGNLEIAHWIIHIFTKKINEKEEA